MTPPLVVSPHLDDAVLSCGQYLAGYHHQLVATVCAAEPPFGRTTSYDERSGFRSGIEAVKHRRVEDLDALLMLHQDPVHLEFLDHQYREGPLDVELVAAVLCALAAGRDRIIGPVGLGHPDHIAVASACRMAARETGVELFAYEELPYRVLDPGAAVTATTLAGWSGPEFIGTGPLDGKQAALGEYGSQLWALDVHACLVPERFWRVPADGDPR